MSKIRAAFEKGKAIIAYITCGDPDLETTAAAVQAAVENGANIIELGIPFSDPTAEGPVIQESSIRALQKGITTDKVFAFVKDLRKTVTIPLVFKTYANVVFSYGAERFFASCGEAGVDGIVLPDLPFEEKEEFQDVSRKYGVELISMIAPAKEERIAQIASEAEGFVYVVPGHEKCVEVGSSDSGSTGCGTGSCDRNSGVRSNGNAMAKSNSVVRDLSSITEIIRRNTDVPCAIFCETGERGELIAAAAVADGIIVEETVVSLLAEYGKDAPAHVGEYVRSLKEVL